MSTIRDALAALDRIIEREDFTFAECSLAEAIISDAKLARAALALPLRGEPVAWRHRQGNYTEVSERQLDVDEIARGWTQEPLYTTPQVPPGLVHVGTINGWSMSPTNHTVQWLRPMQNGEKLFAAPPLAAAPKEPDPTP